MNALSALRNQVYKNIDQFPNRRFFTPVDEFWKVLSDLPKDLNLIECGSGMGDLLTEAVEHGIRLGGVDPIWREGQHIAVHKMDAMQLTWSSERWPLICRPDHSGWAQDVIVRAKQHGATTLFVGLPSNYRWDLQHFFTKAHPRIVGAEGEKLYWIKP
ncbi:MAG TPA: hypothetical protein ENI23_15035 [bacterium]|nr:hypothetical protein [bacterium]